MQTQGTFERLRLEEFPAVIKCRGESHRGGELGQTPAERLPHCLSFSRRHRQQHQEATSSLGHVGERRRTGTDDGVPFPITVATASVHNLRTIRYRLRTRVRLRPAPTLLAASPQKRE